MAHMVQVQNVEEIAVNKYEIPMKYEMTSKVCKISVSTSDSGK